MRTILFLFTFVISMPSYADQEEAQRPFRIYELQEVGLEVWVPANPEWTVSKDQRGDLEAIILTTPPLYYPSTAIDIVFQKDRIIEREDFQEIAFSVLSEARKNSGNQEILNPQLIEESSYGEIRGYEDEFITVFENKNISVQSFVGLFPSGRVITLLTLCPENQIDHISVLKEKIYGKISVLE